MCLDLNTLQLVWVQDCLDDSNGSPVMSIEDGKAYLYASTSFHLGWRSSSTAPIPIWKIDAETGEILWKTEYDCRSVSDLSGGVQSTIALGKNNLSDNLYVTVSRTGGLANGVLACLDKKTGKINLRLRPKGRWQSDLCDKRRNDVSVRRKKRRSAGRAACKRQLHRSLAGGIRRQACDRNQRVPDLRDKNFVVVFWGRE